MIEWTLILNLSLVIFYIFLGMYVLLRVLYYLEEQEVYLVGGLWHCFVVLPLVKILPCGGNSGALMHLEESVVAVEPRTCW